MQEGRTQIVEVQGHNYYVVDEDRTKGDRRCDGPALSSFFIDGGGSTIVNNVRESHRLKNRIDESLTVTNDSHVIAGDDVQEVRLDRNVGKHTCDERALKKKKVTLSNNVRLRGPKVGIRCAGRNETTRLLWLNEFYLVHEGSRRKGNMYVYEALQFSLGEHLPAEEVQNMTERMRRSIWVQGRCYLPAEHVRHFSKSKTGYMFHTELHDGDARTALFGFCPEVVRVENWLTWHQMRSVSTDVPRIVHAEDVQTRRLHVSGRINHFVCGVTACQDFISKSFTLARLPRTSFSMYPEEKLGMEINSPTMMWAQIDDIFHKVRVCMSCGRQGTTSARFSMPLLCTVYDFWQVPLDY
jgi:hypothetical protein